MMTSAVARLNQFLRSIVQSQPLGRWLSAPNTPVQWDLIRTRDIEFCFWALLVDGLQVPPWLHHPDGNGWLRALGLDKTSWLAWLTRTEAESRLAITRAGEAVRTESPGGLLPRPEPPLVYWPEGSPMRDALARRWHTYRFRNDPEELFVGPTYSYRRGKRSLVGLASGVPRTKGRWQPGGPSLRALRPALRELGSLRIYVVRYPVPVAQPLPPSTAIIGSPSADLCGRALSGLVVRAARDLMERQ